MVQRVGTLFTNLVTAYGAAYLIQLTQCDHVSVRNDNICCRQRTVYICHVRRCTASGSAAPASIRLRNESWTRRRGSCTLAVRIYSYTHLHIFTRHTPESPTDSAHNLWMRFQDSCCAPVHTRPLLYEIRIYLSSLLDRPTIHHPSRALQTVRCKFKVAFMAFIAPARVPTKPTPAVQPSTWCGTDATPMQSNCSNSRTKEIMDVA